MQVSVDISLYPLHQGYIPQIDAFILLLNQEPEVKVITNVLSTQLYGSTKPSWDYSLGNGRPHGDS